MRSLEIQDFHQSPAWINESIKDAEAIARAAEKFKVDFISSAGDFHHRGVMANNSHSWEKYMLPPRILQSVAQVYYIYGTRSHDNDGSYAHFADIGWKQVGIGKHYNHNGLLITGLPEITPEVIASKFPNKNKTEIIEAQYDLVQAIFEQYYKAIILTHNGPTLFMGHGHISGCKFKDTQKPRTSDFMFSEAMLKDIGADRYQFGHIHLRQDFKTIWGGYGGSAHITWNETGFIPGFNVIDWDEKIVTRIPFDKLERKKIQISMIDDIPKASEVISSSKIPMDYWIEVVCDDEFDKEFDKDESLKEYQERFSNLIGPNSRITTKIERSTNSRVSEDKYEECKSLEEIYKLFNENAPESVLRKVREAELACYSDADGIRIQKNINIETLHVRGGIPTYENGCDEVFIDFRQIPVGTNIFKGPNGKGKSFYIGLAHPYPMHLPSGSNVKDLFVIKDSFITRTFRVNDDIVKQKILIDPTLKNPTAKYFMDINGKPVDGCKGNIKDFIKAVDEIFGPIEPFISYVFKGQDEFKDVPSLENAKESDLREIYTILSGSDRSKIKSFAHDKAIYLGKKNELVKKEIETIQSILENEDELTSQSLTLNKSLDEKKYQLQSEKDRLDSLEKSKKDFDSVYRNNSLIQAEIKALSGEASKISSRKLELDALLNTANSIDAKLLYQKLGELRAVIEKSEKLKSESAALKTQYSNDVTDWMKTEEELNNKKRVIENEMAPHKAVIDRIPGEIQHLKNQIQAWNTMIEENSVPCEHCNKLSSASKTRIHNLNCQIQQANISIVEKENILKEKQNIRSIKAVEYRAISDQQTKRPEEPARIKEISEIIWNMKINDVKSEYSSIESKLSNIDSTEGIEKELKDLEIRRIELVKSISEKNDSMHEFNKDEYEKILESIIICSESINTLSSETGSIESSIKALNDRIEKNLKNKNRIDEITKESGQDIIDLREWEEIEKNFSPKGIPAMELSLIAPIVDKRANNWLEKHCPRYQVETITQDYDSTGKNIIERFRILVHDSAGGITKNLPVISGGQSVWVTRSVRESLNYESNKRSGIQWGYCVEDECDAALDHDIMPVYYEMVSKSLEGRKLIAVSHSPEAWSSADHVHDITDFYKDYDGN